MLYYAMFMTVCLFPNRKNVLFEVTMCFFLAPTGEALATGFSTAVQLSENG